MKLLLALVVALVACDVCEPEPEAFNGGRAVRWTWEPSGRECVTYQTLWCEYTLCQDPGVCGWPLVERGCW